MLVSSGPPDDDNFTLRDVLAGRHLRYAKGAPLANLDPRMLDTVESNLVRFANSTGKLSRPG